MAISNQPVVGLHGHRPPPRTVDTKLNKADGFVYNRLVWIGPIHLIAMNPTSPRTIYLPSSGGHTSSRIVPESIDRRRFPFRQYSIDEDGSLVCRTRNTAKELRSRPYDISPKTATRDLPRRSPTPTSTPGSASAADILNKMIPAIMKDPAAFEESIPAICAEHNIDPPILESLVQSLKLANKPEPPRVPDQPAAPLSSTLLIPFRHDRPFPTGRGATVWFTSESTYTVSAPPPRLQVVVGDLYIHTNTSKNLRQVWMFDTDAGWKVVDTAAQISHPTNRDRVLNIRFDGTPSWVASTPGAVSSINRRVRK